MDSQNNVRSYKSLKSKNEIRNDQEVSYSTEGIYTVIRLIGSNYLELLRIIQNIK